MRNLFANWKTTLSSLLSAFFGFVYFDPSLFPHWLVSLSKYVFVGGLAAVGILAKDHDVTGGTKSNGTLT